MGWVREMGDDDESAIRQIAADYLQAMDRRPEMRCLVVCPTHAEAASDHRRRSATSSGTPGSSSEDHEFTRLVAVDASEAERGQATTYRPGDVIEFHQNAKGGFTKGAAAGGR